MVSSFLVFVVFHCVFFQQCLSCFMVSSFYCVCRVSCCCRSQEPVSKSRVARVPAVFPLSPHSSMRALAARCSAVNAPHGAPVLVLSSPPHPTAPLAVSSVRRQACLPRHRLTILSSTSALQGRRRAAQLAGGPSRHHLITSCCQPPQCRAVNVPNSLLAALHAAAEPPPAAPALLIHLSTALQGRQRAAQPTGGAARRR